MKKAINRKNFIPREKLHITKKDSPSKETLRKAATIKFKFMGSKDLNLFCDEKGYLQ